MLKNKNHKTLPKKKILIGAAIVIIAVIVAVIAIMMADNEEKTKKLKRASDPELARAMTYDQFVDGDENVEGTDYVKFSAFFLRDVNNDGYAEKIKGTCKQIGKEDTLYMEVNVQTEGMLKNGKIEIDGKNFYLVTTAPKDNELKDNYVSTNTKVMEFSDLNNGTQKLLTGVIRSGDYSYSSSTASAIGSNINNLSRNDNKIIFTGTYIGVDNTETEIRKEINLTTDWYGTATASLYASNSTHYDIENRTDEENGTITFDVDINSQETKGLLNINKNYVEGTIPQLNGYDPISVTTTSATTSFNYDETTKKFTLTREATAGEDGKITSSVSRYNYYKITIKYPIAAYETMDSKIVTIEIPVMTYYTGYNNPNKEFVNPYKSNEAKSTLLWTFRGPQEYATKYEVTVGEYLTNPTYRYTVSKKKPLKIYNELSDEEKDDTYNVKWYISKGTNESSDGIVMKETATGAEQVSDQFVKTDASKDSMENLTTNIGVSFVNADNFLAEDGWIKVYDDETGDLLVTFTKDDWNKYTKENPYKFDLPVKHIRVETSETQPSQYFTVYSKKELDDEYITTNYTREQFDELQYIRSQFSVYTGEKLIGTINHTAHYEEPYSIASLKLSKNTLSTQVTEKNEKLTISATANESQNQLPWKNGSFLIKVPQDIITTEINNITSTNTNVTITSSEYIENDNGKFIKINTKNTTSAGQTFDIVIDANITPDPRIATQTENFELYAANEDGVDYYNGASDIYDINNNLNTTEKVHKSTTSVSLIAPNSLLTNQTASNFDKNGTQVVSPQIADVKPPLATVEQYTEEKTIRIGAQIKNNYASTISEVKLLGKIPFEGNTYVISEENLNSTFTTKMTDAGIEVPDGLKDKIKVYYSENENPDRDTSKAENNWKTADQIENWDNVKTYLVDFQNEEIPVGTEYTFYYTVKIPNGLAYNKIAYSHHGVYFALNTPEGKYRTQTEPNKIGIRIAERYGLEIQKYQANKTNLVPGATYKITKEATDESDEESKTAVTNAEGKLELDNLYAESNYTIEEIKVPENYELNTNILKFIGHVQKDGSLQIEKREGATREDIVIEKQQNGEETKSKVIVKLEDEAKAKLKITKTEKDTTTPVRGIRFKLTGTGLPESGKNVTTNINGEINIKGLKIGEEYTLEETRATGYYLANQIKFTITNNGGTYTVNITEGETKATTITEEENIPVINMNIEDEKIPTYDLEISKIKKVTSVTSGEDGTQQEETTYLQGAKFKLYKGTKELGSYITDENGKITISGLYQYIDGKDEEATYMLKETLAPDGYAKVKDITFKVDGSTGELKFVNTEGKEEKYTVDGTTVKLTIEDSPSFKLIKKDAETGERLANIKFAIYDVEDGTTPAKNSKGEILGTKEIIDGKEYYTVTTDSNGELTADLPEGMYKAVEVEAPEKYDISEPYYFGIGASREGKVGLKATWAEGIGGTGDDEISVVTETSDGGYIAGGYFSSSIVLGNGDNLTSKGSTDGIIIKYNAAGEVEWAEGIGGTGDDEISVVTETSDGGYIVGGYFFSSSIDLGNGISLKNKSSTSYSDGMIIKYNARGEVEWAEGIGGSYNDRITSVSETTDGGYIVGGYFISSSIDLGNEISLTNNGNNDGVIIKYNARGEVEWAEGIGGSYSDRITSVAGTSDGGYIVGGYFYSSSIDLGNGISLTNKNSNYTDGMIIKYNARGEVEWAEGIGGSYYEYIESVSETTDGGYIVGGYFRSSSIDLGNGISLTNKGYDDGVIIKYNARGEVEWAEGIGGSYSEYIESVAETKDGGYIVGGYFYISIDLGNGISLTNKGSSDGMIIKYNARGEVEWAQGIGETSDDRIYSVAETSDGGYIVGGYFLSSSIDLGNGKSLTNKGSDDGMVIKLEKIERPTPTVKKAYGIGGTNDDRITSVTETTDGGYIVGGYFLSSSIDLGNGKSLKNKGSTSYSDGMIIKYDESGEVEWAEGIGGSYNDRITSVIETTDGGYIVGGYFESSSIDLGNGKSLTNKGSDDGMVIKYNARGEVEWAEGIGKTYSDQVNSIAETSDGGYIVGGAFKSSSIDLGNGISLTNNGNEDGMIIKYDASGEVEWAEGIGGTNDDRITSVTETTDGGYIVGGYFLSSSIDLGNGKSLTNKNSGREDGMVIKYNATGEVEWTEGIGGGYKDGITSVAGTRDGGYIIGGYFGDSIEIGNGGSLSHNYNSSGDSDGMIIKYNARGEVEWAEGIGGSNSEYIESVAETKDGGYIVGGYFYSSIGSIGLGNGIRISLRNKGNDDGMIIKYNARGKVEWAEGIGGTHYDYITSVAETSDGSYIVGGYFKSSSIDLGNGKSLINKGDTDGMVLKIVDQAGVPEVQELEVINNRKKFKITTDIKEIDNIKGGSISGEDKAPYEMVKYGDSSTKEIKMIPDENYEIIGITVNGEAYNFVTNKDGSYTMPVFTNITENKHIVVTYSLKNNKITINKVDKDTKAKLSGAKFKLDQLEERTEPENNAIIGVLTDNGQEYTKVNTEEEISDKLGELTNNGTYYFVKNEDGTYAPTNSKTYQTANGGTTGIQNVTANSYIPIDLSDLSGKYAVVINARCSSESADYGYATITENVTAPTYSSTTGRFMYVSGTQNAKDYTSSILEGGKVYYLHLGYRKDGSVDTNEDQIVINSIKLYTANTTINVYNFKNENGKYESTNQGEDNTVSNSYIPIDLTNYTGKYNLTVNAEISSEGSDCGYVTITENTTRASYNSSTGRFVYISGTQSAKDYTTVLQGGKMYYLHLGYYKNASTSSGDDKFTVNSINISLNDSELYHTTVETNSDGQAITQIPFGKYAITEIQAPDGYWINETPRIVEFRSTEGAVHEFTIENEARAKLIVHHYIKRTTTKLAEDENYESKNGEKYITTPKIDLDKYELEVDENGKQILPDNAVGTYKTGRTEVTYYYVEKKIPLTVHHYIEGTTEKVPLKDGNIAEDVNESGKEGETYTTSAVPDEALSDEYELIETPLNANGTYSGNEVIVTYYYKKVSRDVNLIKYQEDGATPLEGAKFTIKSKDDSKNNDVIKAEEIQNNGTYYFENSSGKYISNNQNKSNTTANSYMKIDMTKASEDATITVNAEISSESNCDIGYATITQYDTAPTYSSSTGRYIYISGTQGAKDYSVTLKKGSIYYLHLGYRKDSSVDSGIDTFTINSIKINDIDYLGYSKTYTTDINGKIQTNLEAGTYEVTEIEAPEGYKLPDNPTTEITITKATTSEDITITNEKKTGTVTVHHYIEGTTDSVPLSDGATASDEIKTGNVGDIYASTARTDISEGYELVAEPDNASGTYIDGNIDVIYYYKTIPTSVVVHHYLEGTTTKLAEDVTFDGIVGDNYTTGVGNVDNKYELVAIPANANGKMTRDQIEVIYYYRLKDTSVLVHHYKEGTSESLSADVTINGKVDDEYTTAVATDIPSKYELVAEPDNKAGVMTVEQTVVTYYYRLKETGVDVHYYKEGTTEKVSEDLEITGRVDDTYTTTPATNVASKYELIEAPANATGTMTEDRITVIYYYRLKDTSVLVHHYLEGTTTSLSPDETINGQVDDTYRTVESTDLLFGKYDLVAEPDNKTGIMTEDQIVVTYYYRLKDTSVLVHHYIKDTTTSLSADVTINGQIDDEYTTTVAGDIPEQYELVAEPDNKAGTMTKEQIVVTYYYQLKNYPYVVNYLEKDTDKILHEAKQGEELVYGSTVNSVDEKIEINGYKFDSFNQDVLTIGTANNVINIYYTKRNDLSYKVNYLEKDTNKVLHAQKVVENMTYEDEVTAIDEIIDIAGYNYNSVDKDTLSITTGENVINIYYTKRNDLSYKVNYLEKDTNKVLHEQKVQTGMTYEDIVTSNDEVIEIDGYNYDSVDKNSLKITTGENIINIYYTKRTDLSYIVNYLEKDTNKILHEQKIQNGMTFEDEITSANEVIAIEGYNYDSVDKDTLVIGTNENVINIYYIKRTDLSYKVNYLEKDTNKVLHEQKVVENMIFEDEVISANEVIAIEGYNYDSVDKDTLIIGTNENVINIYYTKRIDLSYSVNYLEKDTNKVLHEQKIQNGLTFEDEITSANEVISINGYNYDSVDKNTLVIGTSENVINIYYTKRNDLSYTVNYLESVTNKVLHEPKVQTEMTYEDKVNAEDEVIDIDGYNYDYPDKYELVIGTDENVINIYYSKVTGLRYTVNYLEKDTNKTLFPSNNQGDMTFGNVINSSDEVITIDGYNFNSFDKDTLTIGTGENVINIYYTKRTDLGYKVNYLEKDTNKVLHDQKVVENMTFEDEITSANEVIAIDGYNYDSVDKATMKITTGENVINVYYTKKTDLSYKVNYLEKTTNKVLHEQKVVENMTFEDEIISANEVITIDGYNYDSVDKVTLKITTGENIINVYYTKRNDLSYKVNYLEKDTNKVLHEQKVVENVTFEDEITSANEVITIDGYNYDSVDKATLKIITGENIINVYYTKRNDLSYTVNYLEKDTNKVLSVQKVQNGMTFEDEITSANEVITIDGYNYDSVDKDTLKITTGENVINIYYTKRNNLSYTVNYLEKNTNKIIHAPKVTGNITFEDEITSADEIITINGYSYDSVDKDKLVITTGTNVINVYYTKINGLAYTVNYLEKDTDKVIHALKTTDNMTFEDEITSADEVIEIDGYNYDSVDKDTLVIGTGENIINIYYTKRNDLSYKVNYLEKDTNKVIHDQKVVENVTFEDEITSANEVIEIDGYNYDSVDKDMLKITTGENIINIYYTKRNDLSYKVNYLEKDTNKVIHDQKVVENVTFEDEILSANEVITIYGYNYDSVDKDVLKISTGENVINIYYTKKEAKVTVHYYEENSTNKVSEDKEITGKVNDEYVTAVADDIPSKYELVATPTNATGTMTEDTIEVIYYFRKKATEVIVRHYEEGTTVKLSEDVTIEGRIDDPYTTVAATDVPIKYELSVTPANANGTMTEDTIEVIYYYRVKDAVLNIRYLEKNTNIELAQPEQQHGKVDEEYITGAKTIDGYTLVEHSGNERGKFEVNPLTVTYYYLYNTKATVQYIDKITGQILEQSTTEGLEGDDFVTESKSFDNYILVEEPAQKTVKMTKEEQVLRYYYIHVSGGVIEKHIDMISGEILSNDTHQGNEGDTYNIPSRTFQGYDLVEDRLPANAQGTMTVNPIEVIYYYIYKSKVTAQYVDKNTGEKLTEDEVQNGHEKDAYVTDRKTFDDYKLVEVPANADGEMTKKDITVTYNYVHTSGGVIVNHIDINTGKQLLDETKQEGYEGDPYETHEENIPGYILVKEKYPANAQGIMAREETRVTYYYVKNTEVNIKYIDKETGEEITEKTNIPGKEGENYTTEPKDIPGYDLVEEPTNKDGTMTAEPIDVIYYYRRPAKVVVKYIDQETNEEIATEEKQEGHQNDEYTTEAKDIKYYKLIATPDNATGTMKVTVTKDENGKDIIEDTTYVTYYYRKLIFNLNIDKKVSSVTVNGEESIINGDLGKVEVHRKELNTAKVEVKYIIKVTNDSELTGKASILEDIPTGMTMNADKNEGWEVKETTATRETKELQPGESEEYLVVLDWENGENNIGMKENTASIISIENEAGFEEKDTTDNEYKADIIVAIGTGGHTYVLIAGGMLLILISLACGVYIIKKND